MIKKQKKRGRRKEGVRRRFLQNGTGPHQWCSPILFLGFYVLSQFVDMLAKTWLQVCSLVLVDNVGLSQFIQHLLYAGIQLDCLFFVSHCTQFTYSITHSLGVIAVVQRSRLCLTNSLHGWFNFLKLGLTQLLLPLRILSDPPAPCHESTTWESLVSASLRDDGLVVPRRVELLFREWKSLVLTDRRRDRSL